MLWAIPCRREPRAHVVLVGHLDSGQTPLLLRSQLGLLLFVVLSVLTVASLAANALLYTLGAFMGDAAVMDLEWIGTLVQGVALVFAIQAELSPYTQGANDNASAVGVVLALTRRALQTPLQHTRITALISGSEEVGCYGMLSYLDEATARTGAELQKAYFINMEGVGRGRLHYATSEGMLKSYRSDPELLRLAGEVAARRPDLGGESVVLRAGYTETGLVVKRGLKGITFVGLEQGRLFKYLPYWHQPEDVLKNLDGQALDRIEEFVWEMLTSIDVAATPLASPAAQQA
jgi:Zn-dependent M28 family amino/carboxypeptidase